MASSVIEPIFAQPGRSKTSLSPLGRLKRLSDASMPIPF